MTAVLDRDCRNRCWARGYFVSTVGIDEVVIREYIQNQGKNNQKSDQNEWHCRLFRKDLRHAASPAFL